MGFGLDSSMSGLCWNANIWGGRLGEEGGGCGGVEEGLQGHDVACISVPGWSFQC